VLTSRTKGSVEFKHQNISAVLLQMGLPYIDGYKPARNYQQALFRGVENYLDTHPEISEQLAESPVLNPLSPPLINLQAVDDFFVDPQAQIIVPLGAEKPWLSRKGRRIDFAQQDARNRQLGLLGEQFAFDIEKRRLLSFGRDDLAGKVEWIAQTCGDGIGFDVLSFDEGDESERFLEVKTTGLGKYFPFYVTANEVRCSEDRPTQFQLYRVFDFSRAPRLYVVRGALSHGCRLEPIVYRASF
jgi:hypothetical protein